AIDVLDALVEVEAVEREECRGQERRQQECCEEQHGGRAQEIGHEPAARRAARAHVAAPSPGAKRMSSTRQVSPTRSPSCGSLSPLFWRITLRYPAGVSTWSSHWLP